MQATGSAGAHRFRDLLTCSRYKLVCKPETEEGGTERHDYGTLTG